MDKYFQRRGFGDLYQSEGHNNLKKKRKDTHIIAHEKCINIYTIDADFDLQRFWDSFLSISGLNRVW